MYTISYSLVFCIISMIWFLCRLVTVIKRKQIDWKTEAQLLLVYICIIVITRFTFFPFSQINGRIQPLIFDLSKAYPFRINLIPFVNLFDYPESISELLINVIGNIAMFIPLGIVFPIIYRRLNTFKKMMLTGIIFSLCIELIQLPFCTRVSDIDDIILNTTGWCLGYAIYYIGRKFLHVNGSDQHSKIQ